MDDLNKLYRVRILGETYVFRSLRIGEFREVSLIEDSSEKELKILRAALVEPRVVDLDDLLSGVAESLIAIVSRITDITEESLMRKIGESRDRLGITDNILALEIEIIKALNYTPDRVEAMSIDEFTDAVALAEAVVGKPLVASGQDDGASAGTGIEDDPVEEDIDPRNRAAMEEVANRAGMRLRNKYQMVKKRRRG